MNDKDKLTTYEVFIEDMLHVFQERFNELNAKYKDLNDYDQGKWMGYWEILDIIKTRQDQISDMLAPD